MNQEQRRPFTCLKCWEGTGRNVDLIDQGTQFNLRSTETIINYKCPECDHVVRMGL